MTVETDWELLAVRLCAIVRRNVDGWQRSFTTPMILALKDSWNADLGWDDTDPDYWH